MTSGEHATVARGGAEPAEPRAPGRRHTRPELHERPARAGTSPVGPDTPGCERARPERLEPPAREGIGIGALAARFGLAAPTLRHWEAMGLLAPARDGAGRRRYGDAEARRVAVIVRAKQAGLSLGSIRALVAAGGSDPRRDILHAEAAALRDRIAAAQASLGLLECALSCASGDFATCDHPHASQPAAPRQRYADLGCIPSSR